MNREEQERGLKTLLIRKSKCLFQDVAKFENNMEYLWTTQDGWSLTFITRVYIDSDRIDSDLYILKNRDGRGWIIEKVAIGTYNYKCWNLDGIPPFDWGPKVFKMLKEKRLW